MFNFALYWPQYTLVALVAFNVVNHCVHHGEKKIEEYNGAIMFIAAVIQMIILTFGGFFDVQV